MRNFALLISLLSIISFTSIGQAQIASVTLDWTAPGDDDNTGTAASYTLRYRTIRPDTTSASAMTTWWTLAITVPGTPVPLVAGTPQSMTYSPVGGFLQGQSYYFILRASDEAGNISGFSNVAVLSIPGDAILPRRVNDLRVRE